MLQNEGFTNEIKTGFLFCLLASKRPIFEMLNPNLINQRKALENQFEGMSDESFTYKDFETTRSLLIQTINKNLTNSDKEFLFSFENCTPDWDLYDFKDFPTIQWKLQNLQKLKETNAKKHNEQLKNLFVSIFIQTLR